MTLLLPEPDYRAEVYVSWGRWVARCPRDACPNAEHFGADPDTGHVGGLTETAFRCAHCRLECPAAWPPPTERVAIERVLGQRPVPSTRNWQPGEDVRGLVAENVEHGVTSVRQQIPGVTV